MKYVLCVCSCFLFSITISGLLAPAKLHAESPFQFVDEAEKRGLFPAAGNMAGHAAAWGDANGDGRPDLYVGGFHKKGTQPNALLLMQKDGSFKADTQPQLAVSGRASGAVFFDFDNDGDLDLYLSNLSGGKDYQATDSKLFRNDGEGRFADISTKSGACPQGFRGRSVCALDYNGDGLLDLLLGAAIHYGSSRRSLLMRNEGKGFFRDVSDEAKMPKEATGLGVVAADLNGDTWPDIVLGGRYGNRVLLNNQRGAFEPAAKMEEAIVWKFPSGDDSSCGVACGDVNRDGRLDLVMGHHFDHPWRASEPVRLYLNAANSSFREHTGLKPLEMKAPHVEIQDFDNDGWPDIMVSIVKFSGDQPQPIIYRNLGCKPGEEPKFKMTGWDANDFPTAEDKAIKRSGDFYAKLIADKKITYVAAGPTVDFDRDGRLDLFFQEWWPDSKSLLLRNETVGGSWLRVAIEGNGSVNRQGVGARVYVYKVGELDRPEALIACSEIAIGIGYCSGQEAIAHLGLGEATVCDLRIMMPCGQGAIMMRDVKVNQQLTVAAK